tara:strand:- start:1211 stop:2047 length:837 start_codon:yes stop_codon:yes gene_type:complete
MKDLIIGASTNYDWDKLKYWINSINKSGFEGDKVLILMNCDAATVKKVNAAGFKVIGFNQDSNGNLTYSSEMPVHVERFGHIYEYLRKNEYRYVITTDVKDVIFQSNPIDFLEANCIRHNLIFSSESMLYKDEPWGNQNLLETFGPYVHGIYKENEIYNVGVLAGTGAAMRDLAINIFTMAANCPIPICDQSTFNFMVSMSPYKETSLYTKSETGWACQLGTTVDPSKLSQFKPHLLEPSPIMEKDVVTTSKGTPYYIVHQYDRVPQWRKVIEEKYGE